mmetsp:Transcript_48988/g.156853  ORF Transcript_48988/g.156853 Transcript_48988/m.156853 type:complete len:117 (-) Transcript_48988:267-617(-)
MPLASKATFHQYSFAHAFLSDWPAKAELKYTLRFPLFGTSRDLHLDGEAHLGMLRRRGYQCGKIRRSCNFPALPGAARAATASAPPPYRGSRGLNSAVPDRWRAHVVEGRLRLHIL